MCRLYTFRSTLPRKVECELIAAQNSLLAQSRCDSAGVSHPDGWGLGYYVGEDLKVTRQRSSAFADEISRVPSPESVGYRRGGK